MDINFLLVSGGAALLALVFALVVFGQIMRRDPGDQKMQDIAKLFQLMVGYEAPLGETVKD